MDNDSPGLRYGPMLAFGGGALLVISYVLRGSFKTEAAAGSRWRSSWPSSNVK